MSKLFKGHVAKVPRIVTAQARFGKRTSFPSLAQICFNIISHCKCFPKRTWEYCRVCRHLVGCLRNSSHLWVCHEGCATFTGIPCGCLHAIRKMRPVRGNLHGFMGKCCTVKTNPHRPTTSKRLSAQACGDKAKAGATNKAAARPQGKLSLSLSLAKRFRPNLSCNWPRGPHSSVFQTKSHPCTSPRTGSMATPSHSGVGTCQLPTTAVSHIHKPEARVLV